MTTIGMSVISDERTSYERIGTQAGVGEITVNKTVRTRCKRGL